MNNERVDRLSWWQHKFYCQLLLKQQPYMQLCMQNLPFLNILSLISKELFQNWSKIIYK